MGTPGLRLIQDLFAKSVDKWSGDAAKSTKHEKSNSVKTEKNNIKVEYIETETVPLDIKIGVNKIKEENKVGLKRELDDTDTDRSRKKRKKANNMSKYGVCGSIKEVVKNETDDIHVSDKKDNKSLITRLLENSAAKFAADSDDFDKVGKGYNSDKIQSKKMKIYKKEINIKTGTIDNLEMGSKVPEKVPDDKNCVIKLSNPSLRKQYDGRHNVTELTKETRKNEMGKRSHLKIKDIEKHKTRALHVHRKTNFQIRRFSPEEDDILQHAIDTFGEKLNFKNLADRLGRDLSSVCTRVKKLKTGSRRNDRREFSLVEDMLIMDKMLERLPGRRLQDLEMHVDTTTAAFLTKLGRTERSGTSRRWGVQIKPWILQHYAGTLNLDIKRMLANFLADTFDNFDSIDWDLVVNKPEFSGHTVFSLKHMFFSNLFKRTRKHQKVEPAEVTLRNIADNTNSGHGVQRKVSEKILNRQKQVIDHFEQLVKKHGITDFL